MVLKGRIKDLMVLPVSPRHPFLFWSLYLGKLTSLRAWLSSVRAAYFLELSRSYCVREGENLWEKFLYEKRYQLKSTVQPFRWVRCHKIISEHKGSKSIETGTIARYSPEGSTVES